MLHGRVLPTIASEGYGCIRTSEVVEPIEYEGEVMPGTMFVGPDRLRRIRNAHGSYFCDVSGRQINKRTVLRPPSWSERAWSEMTSQPERKRAWEEFWSSRQPA